MAVLDFVMHLLRLTDGGDVQITLVASTLQCLHRETFIQLARGLVGKITANKHGVCSCNSFREVSSPPLSSASHISEASVFLKSGQQIQISLLIKKQIFNFNLLLYSPKGLIFFLLKFIVTKEASGERHKRNKTETSTA